MNNDKKLKKGLNETYKKEAEGHKHEEVKKGAQGEKGAKEMEREAEGKKKSTAECGCKYF